MSSSQLLAEYDSMTQVAAEQRRARNTLIKLQDDRREARLDAGALGKIVASQDLLATFRRVDQATRAGIWDVAHRCEDLSDGVREIRNLFRWVDEAVAEHFEALQGVAG